MSASPEDVLDKARAAFRSGQHAEALAQYEYFFDHALDDDPYTLYGVRLSYCLSEWAKLGKKYPQALERLEQKKQDALGQLHQTRNPERFHDFIAICEYLQCKEEPIDQFLSLHTSDEDLAKEIVRFIWNELVEAQQWKVCEAYLASPTEKYESVLAKFDQAMNVCKSDPTLGADDFEQQIKGWYVRDASNLLLVLTNSNRKDDISSLHRRIDSDMQSRGYPELITQIHERVAF